MSALIDREREPSAAELRWFGVLFLGFASVVAGVIHLRSGRVGLPVGLVSGAALLTAIYYALPPLRRALLRGWVVVTYPLGWLGSHLALGLFYFVLLTPVALLMRLFGRDALQRRIQRDRRSYWQVHAAPSRANRYWHQY
jgi:hypothetical protein